MSLSFVLMMIGTCVILVLGVPAMMWLLNRIRPQTPAQIERDRLIAEARRNVRRRIDRLPP